METSVMILINGERSRNKISNKTDRHRSLSEQSPNLL